jgi:hypothetical protein
MNIPQIEKIILDKTSNVILSKNPLYCEYCITFNKETCNKHNLNENTIYKASLDIENQGLRFQITINETPKTYLYFTLASVNKIIDIKENVWGIPKN